ncbi:MAG: hypothetical protein AAFP78_06515 [Pseudomonadota bacterium]
MVWRLEEFGGALKPLGEGEDAINRDPDRWASWVIPANSHTPDWVRRVFCRLMQLDQDKDQQFDFSKEFKSVIRLEPDYDTLGRWFLAALIADRYSGLLGAFDRSSAFDEGKAEEIEAFARAVVLEAQKAPEARTPIPANPLASLFSARTPFPTEDALHEAENVLEWSLNWHGLGLMPIPYPELIRSFSGNLLRSAKYALLTPTERRSTAEFAGKDRDGAE